MLVLLLLVLLLIVLSSAGPDMQKAAIWSDDDGKPMCGGLAR